MKPSKDNETPPPLQESLAMGDQLERIRQQRSRNTVRRSVRGSADKKLTAAQEDLVATLYLPPDSRNGKKPFNIRLEKDLLTRLESLVQTFKGVEKTRCVELALDRLLSELGF